MTNVDTLAILSKLMTANKAEVTLKDTLQDDEKNAKMAAAKALAERMFKLVKPEMTLIQFAALWRATATIAGHRNLSREFVTWTAMLRIDPVTVAQFEAAIQKAQEAAEKEAAAKKPKHKK